jgi:hypothetical protein
LAGGVGRPRLEWNQAGIIMRLRVLLVTLGLLSIAPPLLAQHNCPHGFDNAGTLTGTVPTESHSMRGVNSVFPRKRWSKKSTFENFQKNPWMGVANCSGKLPANLLTPAIQGPAPRCSKAGFSFRVFFPPVSTSRDAMLDKAVPEHQ